MNLGVVVCMIVRMVNVVPRVYYSMGCRIGRLRSDIHDWFWLFNAAFCQAF